MKKVIGYLGLGAIVVAGSLFGYKFATDNEFRGRLTRGAQDMYKESKKKVDSVERRHHMFHMKRCLRFVAFEATLLKLTARGIDVSPA